MDNERVFKCTCSTLIIRQLHYFSPNGTFSSNKNLQTQSMSHGAHSRALYFKTWKCASLTLCIKTLSTVHHIFVPVTLWQYVWLFDVPAWCQVRSVIPAWFSELSTRTDLLRAAWSITLCLSLIHSTFRRVCMNMCTGVCLRVSTKEW